MNDTAAFPSAITLSNSVDSPRVRILPDGRMARADAAVYLGRKPKTLAIWHTKGKGPRSVLVGGRRFYYLSDLENFVTEGNQPQTLIEDKNAADESRTAAKDDEVIQAEAETYEGEAESETPEAA